MNNGDVRVFGLVVGGCVLDDIRMRVPHGQEVVIPAEKACKSKDLYRAINQKSIFALPSQPAVQHAAPVTHVREDVLMERNGFLENRCRQLEADNLRLQEENDRLKEAAVLSMAVQEQGRLDTILKAIQDIKGAAPVYVNGANGTVPPARPEVADGTAPSFIPAEISPKDAEVRIGVQRETGESDVSAATSKLRQMRRGAPG